MSSKVTEFLKVDTNSPFTSYVQAISLNGQQYADKVALNYLLDGDLEQVVGITFEELSTRAWRIAEQLRRAYPAQSRVLLLCPPGNEFVITFIACLYARMVAVPCVQPTKREHEWEKTFAIFDNCEPLVVLTLDKHLDYYQEKFASRDCDVKSIDTLVSVPAKGKARYGDIEASDVAFLQYTSGSTGVPKGVVITHQNLFHHVQMLRLSIGLSEQDVLVHWLPLFHDMGLIATLTSLFNGFTCHYMAPTAFLQRPARWLQAITHYQGTITTAPNFSYELCAQRIDDEQKQSIDLSSLKHALNGSEPVKVSTVEGFYHAFANQNLKKQVLKPVYGMAEATLLISIPRAGQLPVYRYLDRRDIEANKVHDVAPESPNCQSFVAAGVVAGGQRLIIADPNTLEKCEYNQVGEIWVQGPSIATRYWRDEQRSADTFGAYVKDTDNGPYMRTGDLGFQDANGELYIASRLKDMLIIRGLNYYPQDIEHTVNSSHPAFQASAGAAFAIEAGDQEKLVVMHEVDRSYARKLDMPEIVAKVRQAVAERHGLQLYALILVGPRSMPKTSSGKVKRWACRNAYYEQSLKTLAQWCATDSVDLAVQDVQTPSHPAPVSPAAKTADVKRDKVVAPDLAQIQSWLLDQVADMVKLPTNQIDIYEPFSIYGMDSVLAVELSGKMEQHWQRKFAATLAYDYPSIATLAEYIAGDNAVSSQNINQQSDADSIAIVGMGCRFPGADNVNAYWHLLDNGENAISAAPQSRFGASASNMLPGGFLTDVDQFDAGFFAISPVEAQVMDPQQRLTMEVVWEALENAAIAPDRIKGQQVGVFMGASSFDYAMDRDPGAGQSAPYWGTGSSHSILANRLSYFLDARGPSLSVDTACSSSLVAVHYACASLRSKESDMAIAGGVNLLLSPAVGDIFRNANMLSTDGQCKTFDASANGYVRGEGCGVVILKRTQDALRDGDNILAIIPGSAINQDGRSNGLTAPNGPSQQKVIKQALQQAQISPSQLGYVEAHGTGTPLGDPIELKALSDVLTSSASGSDAGHCYVGSVKTNIGHLEAAAGIAGLIKTVLSLQHNRIVQHLHFEQLNPEIDLQNTPVKIPDHPQNWQANGQVRYAGVSSFGFGGTNAHVILQEAPVQHQEGQELAIAESDSPVILPLSAKSPAALAALAERFADYVQHHDNLPLSAIGQTLTYDRSHFEHRLALVAQDQQTLHQALLAHTQGMPHGAVVERPENIRNIGKIAFLFSGQGSQYLGMGAELYRTQPVFKTSFDFCRGVLAPLLEKDILEFIAPLSDTDTGVLSYLINQTDFTQPLLFAFEYSLAQLWLSFGVKPDALFGHSIGEYVAACVAGALDPADGLKLAALRGKLMQSIEHDGGMMAVFAPYEQVQGYAGHFDLSVAAVNGPKNTVLSGELVHIEAAEKALEELGVRAERLKVSQAFHSHVLQPIVDEFRAAVAAIEFKAPKIPVVSGLTGNPMTADTMADPDYWCRQSIEAVQFASAVDTLLHVQGIHTLIEVGPKPTLVNMGKQCVAADPQDQHAYLWLASSYSGKPDDLQISLALAKLYCMGHPIEWSGFWGREAYQKQMLPNYPFQRQSHWIAARGSAVSAGDNTSSVVAEVATASVQPMAPQAAHAAVIQAEQPNAAAMSIKPENIILSTLVQDMSDWSGIAPADINVDENLFHIGIDSLILMKAKQKIANDYQVDIEMGQFYDHADSLRRMASYIHAHLDPEMKAEIEAQAQQQSAALRPQGEPQQPSVQSHSVAQAETHAGLPAGMPQIPATTGAGGSVDQLIQLQMQAIAQQNQLMQMQLQYIANPGQMPQVSGQGLASGAAPAPVPASAHVPQTAVSAAAFSAADIQEPAPVAQRKAPSNSKMRTSMKADLLNSKQLKFIQQFCQRFNARTQKSKQFAEQYRPVLADRIASMLFNKPLKELIYPVVANKSQGPRVWDIDDNEYIDIAMGYGTNYLGHNPTFVVPPMERQLKEGFHLGPQFEMAGEVAQMICDMTGMERVTFSNTGTEAVMSALRVARSVTGRNKIVMFENSYHGTLDSVLAMPSARGTVSIAPGIPQSLVDDIIVLKYNDPSSLEIIRERGREIAGVLVEPVQTRALSWPSKSYIQTLRQLTEDLGIALIFDEVVTGFRLAPGGAQEVFGVQADIAAYGKLLGGGMPIGLIAGSGRFMDAIDGGLWQYGDDSIPQKVVTVFGGTFVKHPLTVASMHAVLTFLKEQGPQLQQSVSDLTTSLVEQLNALFAEFHAPMRARNCGPIFRFDPYGEIAEAQFQAVVEDLFFYLLLENGVYSWEGRICNLSVTHTQEDIDFVVRAARASVQELAENGFFAGPEDPAPKNDLPDLSHKSFSTQLTSSMSEASAKAIVPAELSASSSQRRLFALSQYEGANIAYHVVDAAEVKGELDVPRLNRCFKMLVARHESLRTGLLEQNGRIIQDVHPEAEIEIHPLQVAPEFVDQALQDFLTPFDLAKPPLFRVALMQVTDGRQLLIWDAHHIVFDGMSGTVLMQELLTLYAGGTLAGKPKQFREHLQLEQNYWQSAKRQKAEAYWLGLFQDEVPRLELLTDYPRPQQQSFAGDTVIFTLEGEELEQFRHFVKEQNASVFIGLFAAYYLFLSKLTAQSDIVVGCPSIGRMSSDFEQSIGMFVNTLAIREWVEPQQSVADFIDRIKRNVLLSFEHEAYPFEKLVEAVNAPRDMSRGVMLDTLFSFETALDREVDIGELQVSEYDFRPAFSMVDLSLEVVEKRSSIKFYLNYCTALFAPETLQHFAAFYREILQQMQSNPDIPVAQLTGLNGTQQEQMLQDWGRAEAPFPTEQSLAELWQLQVEAAPDDIALVFADTQLSYEQLNQKANQIAHYLIDEGVEPDTLVGLCVNRSVEMVAGILGIIKAGGAYVPLDPDYPKERLSFMLQDAGMELILTQSSLLSSLPLSEQKVLCLDTDTEVLSHHPIEDPYVPELSHHDLAYVIYTSGSTGQPKGVMVQHASVVRLVYDNNWAEFAPDTVALLQSSISFDAATFEIWAPLLNGGRLVVYDGIAGDVTHLTETVTSQQINTLFLSSGIFAQWPDNQTQMPSLRYLVVGGDVLSPTVVQNFYRNNPELEIINGYGPTENTTFSTTYTVPRDFDYRRSLPIGAPISQSSVYVLNQEQQPVPVGAVGELYLGGVGLARGYLNLPHLTAEKFIHDPFSEVFDARLYRTGDLVRWLADGNIEFVGRVDDQIKLRGYRVELAEVENQLLALSNVNKALVMLREDSPNDKRLVAYVVLHCEADESEADSGTSARSVADLQAQLSRVLPHYMIPSAYVILPQLPLTVNGKVDRKALPMPTVSDVVQQQYVAPETATQKLLAELWGGLLQLEADSIGTQDNFFALGGHSLLLVQLISQLQEAGHQVPVQALLTARNLASMAEVLDASDSDTAQATFTVPANGIPEGCEQITPDMLSLLSLSESALQQVVNSVPGGDRNIQDIYPLAPLQEGVLFHHLLDPNDDPYIINTRMTLASKAQLQAFASALQFVINRHDILRTSFVTEGLAKPVQVVWREAELVLESVSLAELERLAEQPDAFVLTQAPLLRVLRAPDPETEQWHVLLTYHHLLFDQVGMAVIESEALSYLAGQQASLPQPEPYRHFVAQALHQVTASDATAYFQARFGDLMEPSLPFNLSDVHGGTRDDFVEDTGFLGESLSRRIKQQAQAYNCSPAILFHSAWALVVAAATAQQDVVFGTVLSGRLQSTPGTERVLGMFINTLPLRLNLSGLSAAALLQETEQRLTELLAYEQVPLTLVQGLTGVSNDQALFSALLNYRYADTEQEKLAAQELAFGIEAQAPTGRSNYPLLVSVDDLGERFAIEVKVSTEVGSQRIIDYLHTAVDSLVTALAHAPQKGAASLSVIPEKEQLQMLQQWNATAQEYPKDWCIHQLFEVQALQEPDNIALVYQQQQLSYAQLNRLANQVAHYLIQQGVTPDTLVGLCIERSLEMVIAALGILKAGGAYVALDPQYPEERLSYMLQDSGINIVLTQDSVAQAIPTDDDSNLALVSLALTDGKLNTPFKKQEKHNPGLETCGLHARNLAFLIYTSGSTGRPKGVMIEQQGVVRLVCNNRFVELNAKTVFLLHSSISFDGATLELWGPLLNGGTVVVYSGIAGDVQGLSCEVLDHQVNTFFLSSGIFSQWPVEQTALPCVEHLLIAGDVLYPKVVQAFHESNPQMRITNGYGPTENTTAATTYVVPRGFDPDAPVPIGEPVSQTTVFVLGEDLQLLPIGAPGELYLGGDGVARGYLNRPDLTAERFVANPFSRDSSERLYRTGDLVRWLPDGNLDFIGRVDNQVKIRGYRVELGEVEAQLLAHDEVENGAVVLRHGTSQKGDNQSGHSGDKQIVAYAVLKPGSEVSISDLRDSLATAMPEYMVPSAYVLMPELPLNMSGKIDRKNLPEPQAQDFAQREYVAPSTPIEQKLAAIWGELLNLASGDISAEDNFFTLGGHSLLVVRLQAQLQEQGWNTQVKTLFELGSLRQLAAYLAQLDSSASAEILPFVAPENRIPADCQLITPDMVPMVPLSVEDLRVISDAVPGGANNIQDIYPLAPLQEGIWFHHLLDPDNDPYLSSCLFEIDSQAQLEAFVAALQQVINRHDALRTSVVTDGIATPVQVVWRQATLPVQTLNPDASTDSRALLAQLRWDTSAIDLAQAPLLDLKVVPDGESGRCYALLFFHHLIADHVGLEIIQSEALAHLMGQAQTLAKPQPYRALVAHSFAQMQSLDAEGFFKSYLADVTEPTLAFGVQNVQGDGQDIQELSLALPSALATQIAELGPNWQLRPAALFHAAWGMVMAATSGQQDVVFGTVLSGRLQGTQGAEQMIGMMINTLPLRLQVQEQGVLEYLQATQDALNALLPYEQMPLSLAQSQSGLNNDVPLFNAMLNFRYSRSEEALGELFASEKLGVRVLDAQERTNYPITVTVDDLGTGYNLSVQVDAEISPRPLLQYFTTAIEQLLQALSQHSQQQPQQPIAGLSVVPPEMLQAQLEEHKQRPLPVQTLGVDALFAQQVSLQGDKTAVSFADTAYSYQQLEQQANRLAHALKARDIGPGALVGIAQTRSLTLLVSVLAVQKAGAAYVPVDPSYPQERIHYMLTDAGLSLLLSDPQVMSSGVLPDNLDYPLLDASDPQWLEGQPDTAPEQQAQWDDLAYVIYTSGSTGKPKGVEVTRGNLSHFIQGMQSLLDLSAKDRFLAVTSLSFDIAGLELYLPLVCGAEVVLGDETLGMDGARLLAQIQQGISAMQATPVTWKVLLSSGWQPNAQSGFKALCGGEAFPLELASSLLQLPIEVWNLYGPTETTIWSAACELSEDLLTNTVPVGYPIANTQLYVLNQQLQPVPTGAQGELYIGGAGVAKGYLQQSELTQSRFVESEYGRIYRTGDLARYRQDGVLECLGRIDNQVKVRGYRIELGEIEHCLSQHPQVQDVAVSASTRTGEAVLVAFVVADAESQPLTSALREQVQAHLPQYMHPSAFIVLDALPLTPNGKIDRRALAQLEVQELQQRAYVAPETDTQKALCNLWQSLLEVEQVGIDDNFFELGGHSLLATRLLMTVNKEFGLMLSIKDVLAKQTVAELARCIDMESKLSAGLGVMPSASDNSEEEAEQWIL